MANVVEFIVEYIDPFILQIDTPPDGTGRQGNVISSNSIDIILPEYCGLGTTKFKKVWPQSPHYQIVPQNIFYDFCACETYTTSQRMSPNTTADIDDVVHSTAHIPGNSPRPPSASVYWKDVWTHIAWKYVWSPIGHSFCRSANHRNRFKRTFSWKIYSSENNLSEDFSSLRYSVLNQCWCLQ